MKIPYVIDNQTYRLVDILNGVLSAKHKDYSLASGLRLVSAGEECVSCRQGTWYQPPYSREDASALAGRVMAQSLWGKALRDNRSG